MGSVDRRRVAAPMLAIAIVGVVVGFGAVRAQTVGPTFNVRDYGAVGNGTTNDTAAIQSANDAAYRAGGGTVLFPAGTYSAMGIKQDSNVRFLGGAGATLRHRNGITSLPIVRSRVVSTRGWISAGSSILTVQSSTKMKPGALVGIRAAGGPSMVQRTTLTAPVFAGTGLFMLRDREGWNTQHRNYLWVDDEIISYNGMSGNTLKDVQRGLFGTAASNHDTGSRVSQAQGFVARIGSVVGKTITLDRAAPKTVKNAAMWTGTVNTALSGLTLDGKRPSDPTPGDIVVAARYELARWARVENNTFLRSAHGGISLDQGTSDSVVTNNVFIDIGNPRDGLGSAVWLFRGVSSNTVSNNQISGDSHHGVFIDDRSVSSTEWDASSDDNVVEANRIDVPPIDGQGGIFVAGSNRNRVLTNDVVSTKRGIVVARSTQGTNPGDSEGNLVRDNRLKGHSWGIHATGSYNSFLANLIELTEKPIVDEGVGNTFA